MKVITTNRLNRFWTNGVKPIKDALANKLNTSSVVNNLLTTQAGFALDARQGKALDDKITALNGKLVKVKTIIKSMNADYVIFSASDLGVGNAHIIAAYIPREPTYGYYYVTGIGVDISGNLYVYFSGAVKHSGVPIKIYYMSA